MNEFLDQHIVGLMILLVLAFLLIVAILLFTKKEQYPKVKPLRQVKDVVNEIVTIYSFEGSIQVEDLKESSHVFVVVGIISAPKVWVWTNFRSTTGFTYIVCTPSEADSFNMNYAVDIYNEFLSRDLGAFLMSNAPIPSEQQLSPFVSNSI